MKLSLVSLGSSLGLVLATPTVRSTKAATRNCEEYMIPVSVSSTVFIPSFEHFNDDFDVVDFVSYLARRDFQTALNPFSGTKNVTGTYTIGATICSPTKDTAKSKTLLLATHGLGYDRRCVFRNIDETCTDYLAGTGTLASKPQTTASWTLR